MLPLQIPFVPSIPPIISAIVVFLFILGGVIALIAVFATDGAWKDQIPGRQGIYAWMRVKGLSERLEDADAILLIPFSDGYMGLERGYYTEQLVGNLAGYETQTGEKFVTEGKGQAKYFIDGAIPVVLCVDPSKMAATVDPVKAALGQKAQIGEYIRVDRSDKPVTQGDQLERVDDSDLPAASESSIELDERAHDELYDIGPPRRVTEGPVSVDDDDVEAVADGSGRVVEEADGYVVSANAAADLIPEPITNHDMELLKQRERNAALDESQILKYVGIGAAIGGIAVSVGAGLMALA